MNTHLAFAKTYQRQITQSAAWRAEHEIAECLDFAANNVLESTCIIRIVRKRYVTAD